MEHNVETITKDAFLKFFDPNFGSDNAELDAKAREQMTPIQMWESIKRIDELEATPLE